MSDEALVWLTGNVGRDPELRFTPGGSPVCKFSIAVTMRKKQGDEWINANTSWYQVVAWDQLANVAAANIEKGSRVVVKGRLKITSFEKDGQTKTIPEVTADTVSIVPKAETHQPVKPLDTERDDPW